MKKKIIAILLGVMVASTTLSTGVSAASQGDVTISYTTQGSTVIDKGGQQVQTGDTSSSAWIYTLAISVSALTIAALLLGKRNREGDEGENTAEF